MEMGPQSTVPCLGEVASWTVHIRLHHGASNNALIALPAFARWSPVARDGGILYSGSSPESSRIMSRAPVAAPRASDSATPMAEASILPIHM
ncbi:hypothetical protein RRF57_002418 [Xylaria bambusicola]|uniref:Uncharacterized protein n=1 Tax=Xylaria bambusicola TaxID=326684 RepID=A0AAN7UEJ7_9PEZI